MNIGIVGYGVIGHVHEQVLKELGFKVKAICDNDPEKLKTVKDALAYEDFEKMLAIEKLDAVHICTPHYLHTEMIIAALNRNINVLCEKPMCIKKEDVPRILRAEESSRATLGICFQNRYNPAVVYAKEYLKDKKISGGYGTVVWKRDRKYYSSGAWRGKKSTEGGGVLINQAIHTVDLLQYLAGEPKNLISNVANDTLKGIIEVEDTAFIKCFNGGEFVVFATNGSAIDFPTSITVKTDSETVTVKQNDVYINGEKKEVGGKAAFYGKSCYGDGHFALIKDFYERVKKGERFPIDGKEGAKSVKIVLSAYESDGKTVNI